jgi:RNA polymerase sigma-70 factor (ECF subfamily)
MALLPTSSDAADVLQETSLVLWSKFDTFELGTNFFAWACKIARLQTLKHYERNRRSATLFDPRALELLSADAMDAAGTEAGSLETLESCLGKLSEADRKVIRGRYERGATVKKMAADIGVPPNLLSKSLGRIRRALLFCMERAIARDS